MRHAGYAANMCSKCSGRGTQRPESMAKICDKEALLRSCQRQEDILSQRICNYCSGAAATATATAGEASTAASSRGRKCSFFRGTCAGSVERRIRGVVPPNENIIGHTAYGGLRYCKAPGAFSSTEHYYQEEDIMQARPPAARG